MKRKCMLFVPHINGIDSSKQDSKETHFKSFVKYSIANIDCVVAFSDQS